MSLTLEHRPDEFSPPPGFPQRVPQAAAEHSIAARCLLAALLVGPAVIHFGMIPSHSSESLVEAVGFAVAGWLGVLLAIGFIARPAARLVTVAAVLNFGMAAIWAVSRTSGLPFGAHAGHPEAATAIDMFSTAMEIAAALLCVGLMIRPTLGRRAGNVGKGLAAVVATFAIAGSSVALASPSARDHAAHGHGDTTAAADGHVHTTGAVDTTASTAADGHVHPVDAVAGAPGVTAAPGAAAAAGAAGAGAGAGAAAGGAGAGAAAGAGTVAGAAADGHAHTASSVAPVAASALASRCDLALNPASFWNETNLVNGGLADANKVGASAEVAALQAITSAPGGEFKDAQVVSLLGNSTEAAYNSWLNWLPTYLATTHAHAATGAVDDNAGHGGHLGPQPWIPMTNPAECEQLSKELAQARAVALKYPHPSDAEAGGWRKVTPYVPGIAAHYMNFRYVDGTFNIDQPEMLLYDGTGPNASMIGLSYFLLSPGDTEPTQGFTGPNDHFHRHVGLCVSGEGVIGDSTTTSEECAAKGGQKLSVAGGWMNHVWIVPGCESPWGLFSGASPLLEDSLHKASGTDGGSCAGSAVRSRFDLKPGSPTNVPKATIGQA
jgi:hypothetical protein